MRMQLSHVKKSTFGHNDCDCLPILISSKTDFEIAAIHAGWRGLSNGIIEKHVRNNNQSRSSLIVWIGPGFVSAVRSGKEVYESFKNKYPYLSQSLFFAKHDKFYVNLEGIATRFVINGNSACFSSQTMYL